MVLKHRRVDLDYIIFKEEILHSEGGEALAESGLVKLWMSHP